MAEYICEEVVLESHVDELTGIRSEIAGLGRPRERVTRCRDCKHAAPYPLADSEKLVCAFHDEMLVNHSDFCSWGEGRGE